MVGMSPKTFHVVTHPCRARKVQGILNWSVISSDHGAVSAPWLKFSAGSRAPVATQHLWTKFVCFFAIVCTYQWRLLEVCSAAGGCSTSSAAGDHNYELLVICASLQLKSSPCRFVKAVVVQEPSGA